MIYGNVAKLVDCYQQEEVEGLNKNLMINLMSQSNYFIFNKSLAKNIGIEETYMLLTLIDANNIFKQKWFFQTAEMLEELTGLKKDKQKRIIDCLVNLNIIEQKNIGIPCKRHFKINYEELEKLLMDFSKLEEVKTENKFEEKPQTSKRNFSNLIIKENNINESNIEKNKKEIQKDIHVKNNIDIALEKVNAISNNKLNIIFLQNNITSLILKLFDELGTDKTIETLENIKENNFIMKTWKSNYSKEEMFISKILKLETFIKISCGMYDETKNIDISVIQSDEELLKKYDF